MQDLKKKLLMLGSFCLFILVGCQISPTSLHFTTPFPKTITNVTTQSALVNLAVQDLRVTKDVSNYRKDGNVIHLNAVPGVDQLFRSAMQQHLNNHQFQLVQNTANVNVLVNVNKFFANIEQGNLRHKMTSEINIEIFVQGAKGNFTKQFKGTRVEEGVLGVNHLEIQKLLEQTYHSIIMDIYNDTEIINAIHKFQ